MKLHTTISTNKANIDIKAQRSTAKVPAIKDLTELKNPEEVFTIVGICVSK